MDESVVVAHQHCEGRSAQHSLIILADQMKNGGITREKYLEERNSLRLRRAVKNKDKTPPPKSSEKRACKDERGAHGTEPRTEVLAKLHKACKKGDSAALRDCLLSNTDLEIDVLEDEGGLLSPLLHVAAESGCCECVSLLLDEGKVPVDAVGEYATTVLFDACYFDRVSVAETVLDHGANIEFQIPDGTTPLYASAFRGHLDCLCLMLHNQAKVYYHRGEEQMTPLHAAIQGGNEMCVARLVEAGHPINARNAAGETPLLAAASFGGAPCGSNGKKDCLMELLRLGADTSVVDKQGRNALKLLLMGGVGCEHCTSVAVERLLEKGASVLQQDCRGESAAEHLDELASAPKIHGPLKRAIKRETLRSKLLRLGTEDLKQPPQLDPAELAAQEEQARSAAAALLEAEEAEKAAAAARREKQKQKKLREKERRAQKKSAPAPAEQLPPPATSELPEAKPQLPTLPTPSESAAERAHSGAVAGPIQSLLELAAGLEEDEGGDSASDSEVAQEVRAFRQRLEACACPRPRITLDPAAFNTLRQGLNSIRLNCACGSPHQHDGGADAEDRDSTLALDDQRADARHTSARVRSSRRTPGHGGDKRAGRGRVDNAHSAAVAPSPEARPCGAASGHRRALHALRPRA